MKYNVKANGQPAYLQLYKQIREDIVSGAYNIGAKLPSKRILAEETGVSVVTVEHTYNLLIEEGYIESKERSGFYVIYRESDFIFQGKSDDEGNDEISSYTKESESKPSFPFSVMSKAMRKVILDFGDKLLEKSQNKGCFPLRQTISAYLKRTVGINADADQIIIGAGAEYLYSLTLQLLGKDKAYALENPCYKRIKQVYEANAIKYELLKMGKNGINSKSLEKSKADVLHITPYNSYPSMISASAGKRREYIEWATKRGGYIIEDNYDSELTVSKKNEETLFDLTDEENVIYINTFSKTISPSIRVGYMVLPKRLVADFDASLGFYSCTVPVFEQYLICELINSGEFERHINRIRRERRKNLTI